MLFSTLAYPPRTKRMRAEGVGAAHKLFGIVSIMSQNVHDAGQGTQRYCAMRKG